jgi:hypothetical protein
MSDKKIPPANEQENTVVTMESPRDHQINLSVNEEDWRGIEAHAARMLPKHPNRRVIPMALAAYDLLKLGLEAVHA